VLFSVDDVIALRTQPCVPVPSSAPVISHPETCWGNVAKIWANHHLLLIVGVANSKLGNATASLPEYLAKKAHLSMHVQLTSSIFKQVNERDLISLGRLEQELVFGEKKSNDIILHLQGWNARRYDFSHAR
jgi:hypothetical protein